MPFSNNDYQKAYNRKIRLAAIAFLGGKCVRCGFTDERALQIDHVKGGGFQERKRLGCSYSLYKKVLSTKEPGVYQLLCANCNWIKRAENGESAPGLRKR